MTILIGVLAGFCAWLVAGIGEINASYLGGWLMIGTAMPMTLVVWLFVWLETQTPG